MPIDYTTLKVIGDKSSTILNNIKLDFTRNIDADTGVYLDNKRIAEHHYCKIIVYDTGSIYFKGSLHKMYNSIKNIYAPNYIPDAPHKGFNGNLFTYDNICEVICYLENLFNTKRQYFVFQKLEIGVNLSISVCPRKITTNLLENQGKKFELRYNENFAQVEKDDYYLKIYNKSNQYNINDNTLRVEIKTKRMREFASTGIKTLADITPDNLYKAILRLYSRWNSVLLYDVTINKNKLNKAQKNELENKFQYPKYWTRIKANNKDKPRKRYLEIVELQSKTLHKEIAEKILKTNISQFN
jgi:acyl-CoA-binding protein